MTELNEPQEGPYLTLLEDGIQVLGNPLPFLPQDHPAVLEDARRLAGFMEGYLDGSFLHEKEAWEQVRAYYALWAWFWTGPRMGQLLRRAHLEGHSPYLYPLYAILYGKSNTGKSTFLRLLLRSMAGASVGLIPGTDLSQALLRSVHQEEDGLPRVVDDISARDMTDKVEKILKGLYEVPLDYHPTPIALSLNSSDPYPGGDEVRKRALMIQTLAVLDTSDRLKAAQVETRAKELERGLTNAFFRAFFPILDRRLEEERDWLRASTEILADFLEEALGKLPDWAKPMGMEDLYRKDADRVDALLADLLAHHPWEVKGGGSSSPWDQMPGGRPRRCLAGC